MTKRCDLIDVGVMSGNNVSHSKRRTRRKFEPNLQKMSFKSEALGVNVTLKIASSTLRTINKYGTLDVFLMNYRFSRMSDKAKLLRKKVTKALEKKGELDKVKIVKEKKVTDAKKVRVRIAKKVAAKKEIKKDDKKK